MPQDCLKKAENRFEHLILPEPEARNYNITYNSFRNKMWYKSRIWLSHQVMDIVFHWDVTVEKLFQHLQNSNPDIWLTYFMCPLSFLKKLSPI